MGVISAGFDPPLDIVFTLNTYTLRELSVKIFFRGHTEKVPQVPMAVCHEFSITGRPL